MSQARSNAIAPIAGSPSTVHHGDSQDARRLYAIHDTERIPAQEITARAMVERRPSVRKVFDRQFGRVQFGLEFSGRGQAALGVPSGCCRRLDYGWCNDG